MEILPLISFTTGVISILSPCILPILPIFVGVSLKSKSKTDLISFIAGLLTIFIAVIFLTGFFTTVFYTYIAHVRLIRNTTFIEEMLFSKLLTAFPLPFEISRVWNYLPTVNNWKIYPQKGRNYTCKLKK